jgi:2-keto-4-pentenoate hydratase
MRFWLGVGAVPDHSKILDTKRTKTITTDNWRKDPRLTAGYAALKTKLIFDQAARNKQVGWKLGFGSPTGLANLKLGAPLAGYLLAERALTNNAHVDIKDWVKPVGEAEIVVYFDRDVRPGSSQDLVLQAICAIGPAIELADLEFIPDDPTKILGTDIFQKHYILGDRDDSRRGGVIDGLIARITMPDGSEKVVTELEELIGKLPEIVTHCADVVGDFSGGIKKGEFILIGSIVPPIALTAGGLFRYSLGDYLALEVNF